MPAQTDVASSRGVVPIRLACPRNAAKRCIGTVRLQTQKKKAGRPQKLGSARFSIASGKRKAIKLKLNQTGRIRLTQGKITLVAVATSRDVHKHKATRSRKITVESKSYANPPPSSFY